MSWPGSKKLLLTAGFAMATMLSGCASGGGGGVETDESPVGDQAAVAEDQEENATRIWKFTGDDELALMAETQVEDEESGSSNSPWNEAILWYSRASLAGDAPPGLNIFSLMLSNTPEPRRRFYVGLYYGRGSSRRGRELQESLRWVTEAGFEVGARAYVTSDSTGVGLFGMLGLRAGGQFWSYTRAIEATDQDGDTDNYSHDAVVVATPYVGVGVSFLQSESMTLGVNASAGYRMLGQITYHDIDEDLFRNVWEFKLNFEITISGE